MKLGSVVKLKGQDVIMTVINIESAKSGELATCMWFDDNKAPQQGTFYLESLDEIFGSLK